MEYSVSLEGTQALIFMGVCGVIVLFMLISRWRIYSKANKPGWAVLIPIYSDIVFFEIADMNILKVILLFIPIANVIVFFSSHVRVAKKFGKGAGFGVFMALIPLIGYPVLAFGKSIYNGDSVSTDEQSSILDVDMSGVPNTSEEPEFQYGYEKESTVIMDPVNQEADQTLNSNIQLEENAVPVENTNIDNIVVEENNDALGATTESMTEEVPVVESAETKPSDVINLGTTQTVEEQPIITETPEVNVSEQPTEEIADIQANLEEVKTVENSALDAQLNSTPTEPVQTENIFNNEVPTENKTEEDFTEVN